MTGSYQFEHFLSAVHRRMTLLRGLERVGLCLLGGCGVLLILMPILIWRGQGAWELVGATLSMAAAAGVAWGVAARPTKLAAAMEADRQLKWSDLLGTALTLRQGGVGDAMHLTVLAMAEARCRGVSPSAIVLNRLGSRGWSGIALAGALVAGVALLGGDRNRSEARAAQPLQSWQDLEKAQEKVNSSQFASGIDLRRAKPGTGGDDDDPLKSAEGQAEETTGVKDSIAASANGAGGAEAGDGAGAGQSASKGKDQAANDPITGGSGNTTGDSTKTSGGGGTASDEGKVGDSSSGTSARVKGRRPAPVWQSDGWPVDRDVARAAIRGGRVPDAYREMVREYFERE